MKLNVKMDLWQSWEQGEGDASFYPEVIEDQIRFDFETNTDLVEMTLPDGKKYNIDEVQLLEIASVLNVARNS